VRRGDRVSGWRPFGTRVGVPANPAALFETLPGLAFGYPEA